MDPSLFELLRAPEGHLSIGASILAVYGLCLGAPLLIIAVALFSALRHWLKAALVKRGFDPRETPVPGPASLCGTVEIAQGMSCAVRVEVTQIGQERESTSLGWSHTWTEIERRIEAHPFYLRLASGERVRVEPAGEPAFIDTLDQVVPVDSRRRRRCAELTAGEKIYVYGELRRGVDPEAEGQGYRAMGEGLVLGAPRRGRMLLSSEPPGGGFARRARLRVYTIFAVMAMVIAAQLILAPYHARRLGGRNETGTVTRLVERKGTKARSRWYDVYVAVARPAGRRAEFKDSLGLDAWKRLRVGTVVPTRFVESWPNASVVGWDATSSFGALLPMGLFMVIFPIIAYLAIAARARTWHDGKLLIDRGEGRLA